MNRRGETALHKGAEGGSVEVNPCDKKCFFTLLLVLTRDDLEWMLTIAEDGTLLEDGLLPGFIQWPGGRNPANKLPESSTRLNRLILQHPQPNAIGQIIEQLGIDGPIEVRPGPTNLIFEMRTNAGELVSLSSASA